jgi:hypothetical protein
VNQEIINVCSSLGFFHETDYIPETSVPTGWVIRTSAADNDWRAVCFGNNLFVAVANSGTGNRIMTSPDGITWTLQTSAADYDWVDICYGLGYYVCISSNGYIMSSPDAITWTLVYTPSTYVQNTHSFESIAFGGGLFISPPDGFLQADKGILFIFSTDGVNFYTYKEQTRFHCTKILYSDFFTTLDWRTGDCYYSNTGLQADWRLAINIGHSSYNIFAKGPSWVFLPWYPLKSPMQENYYIRTVTDIFSPSTLQKVIPLESVHFSSICYGDGIFVAVTHSSGNNPTFISNDGIDWQTLAPATNNSWTSICFGLNTFVAVASSGTGNRVMTFSRF